MATDARLSVGLSSHPKTKKLIRRLGTDGAWRMVCLFLWCAANRSDGDLSGMSDEDIELAVDFDGEEGAFVATLREVGFIDGDEYASSIHDWEEHNPWAAGAEARSEKARWAALCKQHGRKEAARMMPEYANRINAASGEDTGGNQPALPNSATSTPAALPESASSTPVAESSSAPSPSPSPSPKEIEPIGSLPTSPAIPCPVQGIVDAYHELMPDNPKVRVLNDSRRRTIAARWREAARLDAMPFGYSTQAEGIAAWRKFFSVCNESDFLTGKKPPSPGRNLPFIADLDFLMSPGGFTKSLENKYHREEA